MKSVTKDQSTVEYIPGCIHNHKKPYETEKKPLEHTLNVGPTGWKWSQLNQEGEVSLTRPAVISPVWRVAGGLHAPAGLTAAETRLVARVLAVERGASGTG